MRSKKDTKKKAAFKKWLRDSFLKRVKAGQLKESDFNSYINGAIKVYAKDKERSL